MRLLARLCIRFGHFPRRQWFYQIVTTQMYREVEDPRNPEASQGYFVLPGNLTRTQTERFAAWWMEMR